MPTYARDARPEDYDAFARLFLELRVPDPTPSAERYASAIAPHAFFLWEDDAPIAYAFWQPLGQLARVINVVVDPRAQGRGVGVALMREIAARATAAKCATWTLNVKPDNAAAIRLYTRLGMSEVARSMAMAIDWKDVGRLPEARGFTTFLVSADEDAPVERALDLPERQIDTLRQGQGRVLLAAREGQTIAGFAGFDPSFPGAAPFAARTPVVARALFDGMRPYAKREHDYVRFVVDAAMAEPMRAAGARSVLEVAKMKGPIPLGTRTDV